MADNEEIEQHYTQASLVQAIRDGVTALGKSIDTLELEDLAPVDEFHIGGRAASIAFLDQLGFSSQDRVLDVGCGIGGASRFVSNRYGANVSGIDLTQNYVDTAREINGWFGLSDHIAVHQGSAMQTPFDGGAFDGAFMLHVGMNIPDKAGLFREIARVLKPDARFGVYDVMRVGDGDLAFPVPWASVADNSAVVGPSDYREKLEAAGFEIENERNRHDFALDFFEQLRAKVAAADGPPPLGLHLLMGASAPQKVQNMIENITLGKIAPVEIIARKAA